PTADEVLADITTKARNVMGAAPGELEEMIAQGGAQRVPLDQYRTWLDTLTPSLREKVLSDWGDPAENRLMAEHADGQTSLIVPAVRYGNIVLMPQPSRAWGEDLE